ncbi:pancreas transcription factor 1 subunit alpha-like, partial [Pseudochaenichthys georgianus]|uniref:pancreas transcription factor 1 subunit alpha-like n=1 Tax=Pseudochaenichthys georgianus TaxID=52239 RepID=UPI00146BD5B9
MFPTRPPAQTLRTQGGRWRCKVTPLSSYMDPKRPSLLTLLSCLTRNPLCSSRPAAAMDVSFCSDLQLHHEAFLFDSLMDTHYNTLAFDAASDPGYFSASSSSLSPTSSVDSFCFSPNAFRTNEPNPLDCLVFKSPAVPQQDAQTLPASTTKKSRSRYPGKKRQTASDREKHRMRDLTKSLNHLRTYLPASVAPEGQTLTKIDTLRLTIRYISYLSAQLGLSEEVLEQKASESVQEPQHLQQFLGQPTESYAQQEADLPSVSPTPKQPSYQ